MTNHREITIAELKVENRKLRNTISELLNAIENSNANIPIEEVRNNANVEKPAIKPPWERQNLTKNEWKKQSGQGGKPDKFD